MIRVGVVGASGKMGRVLCAAIVDDPDLELVAGVGRTSAGARLGELIGRPSVAVVVADRLDALVEARAEVAVDFTHPETVVEHARWYAAHRLHAVIGTSGITPDKLAAIEAAVRRHGTNVVIGPDFSYGGAVFLAMLRMAARHFPEIELIEQHLPAKADAPSGTTMNTARELARVRRDARGSSSKEIVPGARGGEIEGIRVHSIRLSGAPGGIEEARFARPGELLTLSITAFDREPFAAGAIIAIKKVMSRPGLTYGLPALLDLDDPDA